MKIESKKIEQESLEKVSKHLEKNGWKFVKAREYQHTYIFRSPDGKSYLHFGDTEKIKKITDVQVKLIDAGYPVASILKTGKFGNFSYVLESSLGNETYGDRFTKSIEGTDFYSFCDAVKKYFEAQLRNPLPAPINYNVRKEVMAENVIEENPDLDLNLINLALDRLQNRLASLPFANSHGDFAARNILESGAIDFEFYSVAPIGLDVFTACAMEDFWMFKTDSGAFQARFSFSKEQQEHLNQILKEICVDYQQTKLSEYQNDFILFKAFWSMAFEKQNAITSGNETKWRFRRAILMYCIDKYIKNESIDTSEFQGLIKI